MLFEYLLNVSGKITASSQKNEIQVTAECRGEKYAFYLEKPDGEIIKKKYSNETSCFFHLDSFGLYKVTFFTILDDTKLISYSYFFASTTGIKQVNKSLISDSSGYKIEYYSQSSKTVIVVFNPAGSSKKSKPFGLRFLLSKGYDVVVVYQEVDTFYQELSFSKFKFLLSDILVDKRTWCYGSSLGAWCAIYYAGAINASVIAASPRQPIHPKFLEFQGKKSDVKYLHTEMFTNPITSENVYIIIDPFEVSDVFTFEEIIRYSYPEASLIEVEYGGHESLFYLNEIKQLGNVFSSLIKNEIPRIESDSSSVYYMFNLSRSYARNKKYDEALCIISSAIEKTANGKLLSRLKFLKLKIEKSLLNSN